MPKQYTWTSKLPEELMVMTYQYYFSRHVLLQLRLHTIGLKYSIEHLASSKQKRREQGWRYEATCEQDVEKEIWGYKRAQNRAWTLSFRFGKVLLCQCPLCVRRRVHMRRLEGPVQFQIGIVL